MIEWMSLADLERHLRTYAPIGIWLRSWFHARTDIDPSSTTGSPPERRFEEGLGEFDVWGGRVDTIPFAIRAGAGPHSGLGFDVLFPVRPRGDRVLLAALDTLRSRLPSWRNPYFDQLPIAAGFGVVVSGGGMPVYTSTARDDAAAVAAFLNQNDPDRYAVVPVGASPPAWIVVGPETGPYISWLDTMSSEESARRQAARWSSETGVPFEVRRHLDHPPRA